MAAERWRSIEEKEVNEHKLIVSLGDRIHYIEKPISVEVLITMFIIPN